MTGKGRHAMHCRGHKPNQERGSALIFCVLILFLLTAISMLATKTTWIEIDFARSDKSEKMAFYAADGGSEASKELIEQAIEERGWPSYVPIDSSDDEYDPVTDRYKLQNIYIVNRDLYRNGDLDAAVPGDDDTVPERDAYLKVNERDTNLRLGSNSRLSTGGAIQMVSGYEGIGKGSAGGGAWILYDIRSRHERGAGGSSSQIKTQWLHVM